MLLILDLILHRILDILCFIHDLKIPLCVYYKRSGQKYKFWRIENRSFFIYAYPVLKYLKSTANLACYTNKNHKIYKNYKNNWMKKILLSRGAQWVSLACTRLTSFFCCTCTRPCSLSGILLSQNTVI